MTANTRDGCYSYTVTYSDGQAQTKCQKVSFRFMGLWDTVLSTDLPWGTYQLAIPAVFRYVAHAVALNEYRSIFPGEAIMPSHGTANTDHLVEMGCLGAHSDIGGGFEDGGLAQVALVWIVDQAKTAGITMGNPERTVSATLNYHDKSDTPGKEVPLATGSPEDRVIR